MDYALLQQKIYGGYAKAALRIGPNYTIYRPSGATNPIVPGNIVTTQPASFNAEDMKYQKPNKYGRPTWYCLTDGTKTLPGDYMIGAGNTFFIAAQQLTLPILAVECNRQVRISRMPVENGPGFVGYSGVVQREEVDVLGTSGAGGTFVSGWPASVLLGGRSDKETVLPSSVKQSGVIILLPRSVPITISEADVIQDDLGREYSIYTAELTDLGWRLQANEEHA
jgi:hypothetical protein